MCRTQILTIQTLMCHTHSLMTIQTLMCRTQSLNIQGFMCRTQLLMNIQTLMCRTQSLNIQGFMCHTQILLTIQKFQCRTHQRKNTRRRKVARRRREKERGMVVVFLNWCSSNDHRECCVCLFACSKKIFFVSLKSLLSIMWILMPSYYLSFLISSKMCFSDGQYPRM